MSDLADIIAGGIQDTQSIKPEFGVGYSEGSIIPFFNVYTSEALSFVPVSLRQSNRNLGSTFIIAHPTHGWLGYLAASVAAGSQPFLGNSTGSWVGIGSLTSGLKFDGTNDYVKINTLMQSGLKTLTVEAWVWIPSHAPTANAYTIYHQADGDTKGIHLAITPSGVPYCNTANGGAYVSTLYPPTGYYTGTTSALALSQWQHVAFVGDGTKLYAYLNGILIGSDVFDSWQGDKNFLVGAVSETPGILYVLSGCMDEFRISNIQRYSTNFYPGKFQYTDDANTNVYYKFDSVTNSVTNDNSSNANHGSVFGPVASGGCGLIPTISGDTMVVTNDGKRMLVKILGGDTTRPQYMAMGSSATAPAVTDTALGSEFTQTRIALNSFTSGDFYAELEMIVPSTIPTTQPNVFKEIGVFTGSPTGSMVMHTVFPNFTKTRDIELQNLVTFKIV